MLRAFFALVKNDGARPKFINHLTAGAARGAWSSLIIDHGNRDNLQFRTDFGNGRENRGALGAVGNSVGRVLYVAPCKYLVF